MKNLTIVEAIAKAIEACKTGKHKAVFALATREFASAASVLINDELYALYGVENPVIAIRDITFKGKRNIVRLLPVCKY
jgi:hypothetical protein